MAITYGIKQVATIDNVNALETKYIDLADSGATKTSTSGTITNEQLTILQASKQNCIIFDNQIYRLQDNEHNSGILTYTYNGYDSEIVSKTITITISTLGWTLTELSASAGGGTNVEANNGETTSATLNTLKVGETNYAVPSGGGGSGVQTLTGTAFFDPPITFSGIFQTSGLMFAQLNDKISNIENVEITIDFSALVPDTIFVFKYDFTTDNLIAILEFEGQKQILNAIPFIANNIQYLMILSNYIELSNEQTSFTTNDTEIEILKYMAKHLTFESREIINGQTIYIDQYVCNLVMDYINYKIKILGVGYYGSKVTFLEIECNGDDYNLTLDYNTFALTHASLT